MSLEVKSAEFVKGFEGYTPTAMWDVNAWRIGHGSDTITMPDGTYRKVKQGDVTTRELAKKDLERRISREFIPRVRTTIGPAYFDRLPEPAKVALISLAYNYGNVTKQAIIEAARKGDTGELARAIVDSTYHDNKSLPENVRNALRERRAKEAALARSAVQKTVAFAKKNTWAIVFVLILIVLAVLLLIYRKKIAEYITKM